MEYFVLEALSPNDALGIYGVHSDAVYRPSPLAILPHALQCSLSVGSGYKAFPFLAFTLWYEASITITCSDDTVEPLRYDMIGQYGEIGMMYIKS